MLVCLSVLLSGVARAQTASVTVECGNPKAKVQTIAAGLALLPPNQPGTLLISGTCHEEVTIISRDRITFQGNPTATIDGGSDPNNFALTILDGHSINVNNITISGALGAGCFLQSTCYFTNVTVQNSLGDGIDAGGRSVLGFTDCVVQNNANDGIQSAGFVFFLGGTVQRNAGDGLGIFPAAELRAGPDSSNVNPVIQNNGGMGIRGASNSTINILGPTVVRGNGGDGIRLQDSSVAALDAASITGNIGHGVRIGDLSFVRFGGTSSSTVSGNMAPDVVCDPQFSATRRLFNNVVGATTNCPAEPAPAP